jgi:hypothetical protein
MLCGYKRRDLSPEYGLLELREVTFLFDSRSLRDIASFLSQMADELDEGKFDRCSHRHIESVIGDWRQRYPNDDLIVAPPAMSDEPT